MSVELDAIKARHRAMWAAGDYPDIAKTINPVSAEVVEALAITGDDDVLDVATGSGNAALFAAARGANVTGLDLTPKLLEVARSRAEQAGAEITFIEGDAEALPFEDRSFDRVMSVFGAMFAPNQEQTAAELVRVCRTGGAVAVTAWTPEGLNGQMFGTIGRHMPPPPPGFRSPVEWGSEERVRQLFAGASEIRCEHRQATGSVRCDSIGDFVDYLERVLGPTAAAKAMLEPEGKWAAARADLEALYERFNTADDGTLAVDPEYLLTIVRP